MADRCRFYRLAGALALTTGTACSPGAQAAAPEVLPACVAQGTAENPLATRSSPLDSVTFATSGRTAKICYSRPSARGRMVMDSLVPYGRSWRTGANEPTTLYLPVAAEIGGAKLAAGRYYITTIPTAGDWTILFNTSNAADPAQILQSLVEVARGSGRSERVATLIERFTIRPERRELILEWERTRVRIPVRPN